MTTRSGYAVTIRGFIPVDPANLADHGKAIAEVNDAKALATGAFALDESPSADAMFCRMLIETFDVKPVTRRAKDGGEAS